MSGSILSIGMTGLTAAQAGLVTTSHNIANVNTLGYSRQQVVQGTQAPMFTGGGFFGQGTTVDTVRRIYSGFLATQTRESTAAATHLGTLRNELEQLDNALGDTSASLAPALGEFFAGVNGVAARPGDIPSRQVMLSDAQALVSRFRQLGQQMSEQQTSANAQITSAVQTINGYANEIALLNNRIALQTAASGGLQNPNDLLDQRDTLITQLNEQIGVSAVMQSDGAINVFMSNGQALVVGSGASKLAALPDTTQPNNVQLALVTGTTTLRLASGDFSGGVVGGLLAFRDGALADAQNGLGRIALVVAQTMNAQNALGVDLAGAAGGPIFTTPVPIVQAALSNTGTAKPAVSVSDTKALTASDYMLEWDGANYAVTRLSDNTTQSFAALPAAVDGLAITLPSGVPAVGDRFLIQPTHFASTQIGVAMTDPAKIAAAAPVMTSLPGSNVGSATISPGSVDASYLAAPPGLPVTLTFAGGQLGGFPATHDVSVTLNGTTVNYPAPPTGVIYQPGASITFGGISIVIAGTPADSDKFVVGRNTNPAGDSRNAVLLAALATSQQVGGTATFDAAYGNLIGTVGATTHQVQVEANAQSALLAQAVAVEQSVSGVNLDEEAANLQRYQQAYQAASKVMVIAATLFDTILSIGR